MLTKHELRSQINNLLKITSLPEDAEDQLFIKLVKHPHIQRATTIAVYLATTTEIKLDRFIQWAWTQNKTLVLPTFTSGSYRFMEYTPNTILENGPYNILQPSSSETSSSHLTISCFLVPGIAFDKQGNRLGHGKGIYDRLLESESGYL